MSKSTRWFRLNLAKALREAAYGLTRLDPGPNVNPDYVEWLLRRAAKELEK